MLYLENLEPRCLLSVTITESDGVNDGILEFDTAIIGEPPPESYIDITNDNDSTIIVTDIRIENQDETGPGLHFNTNLLPGLYIDAHTTLRIPIYFAPQTAGELEEWLIVETTDVVDDKIRIALSGTSFDIFVWPPGNSNLTFFDTGVGQVQEELVSVYYFDGMEDSTIIISDIQVTGNCFSYEQPAPPETLPSTIYPGYDLGFYPWFSRIPDYTANEVVELEIGVPETGTLGTELDGFGRPIWDGDDIYSFTAQPGQIIEVDALLENYGDLTIQVYSDGGQLVAWDSEIEVDDLYMPSVFTNVVFPVPDNPDMDDTDEFLYYVEVVGYSRMNPDTYQIMVSTSTQTIPEVSFTDNPVVPSYEGVIGNDQLYNEEIQWLQFDADFGDQIDLRLEYDHTSDPNEEPPLGITIFDKNGRELDQDLFAHPDAEGIFYTLLSEGPFYLRVNNMDSGRYEYEISLVKLGSMLELEPGETLELPVYFRPDSRGTFSGAFQFNISADDVVLKTVNYTLQGESFPGYLSIVDVAVPNLTVYTYNQTVFSYAQSGEPLNVVATITNWGMGDIQQSADLVYFLSVDTIYDNLDIRLSPDLPINPLFVNNSDIVGGSVNIPDGLEGEYYLFAVVENDVAMVSEPLIISPENLLVTDSVDDPFDKLIDYGERPLNTFNTEYVWLFNRGNSPVTVTDYSLETGGVFQFPEPGSPDYQAPPIVIMPGQTGSIPVIFAPETFPITGEQILTDILTVHTSESALPYEFDLTAALAGANLIVLENSGQGENDNKMDLGSVRVDNSSAATFTLVNLGDQQLYINDIDFNSGILTAFSYSIMGGGNLPLTLQPFGDLNDGNRAEFLLTFTPNYTGNFTDTLIIHSSDTTGDYMLQLSGVGVSPTLVVQESLGIENDNYLPFGWRPLNPSASTSIILSNAGTDTLNLKGWEFKTNAFEVDIPNHPDNDLDNIPLQPGELLTLIITFPASAEGSFNDTFTIFSDDGKYEINLSSLAGFSALPSLGFEYGGDPYDSLALDIGEVLLGQSASEPFKITNNGNVELAVDSISIVGDDGFSLVGADLTQPEILQPSEKLTILVKFDATPDLPIQNFQGSVIISSTAQPLAPIVVPVSSAIVTPEIDVSSSVLDFGAIDESQQKTLDLQIFNSGNTDLIITDWSAQDPQFSIDVPPQNLSDNNLVIAPYQTITVAVTFDPQQYGITETQFNLLSNDYDEPITTVTLSAQSLGRPSPILPNTSYAFYDVDGDLVKVALNEGRAILYLNNGLLNHADIDTLMLYDTTPNTELKITVSGGQTSINSIQSDKRSLGSINTPNVTINHSIDINGSLDELLLNNVSDNAAIHVAQYSSKPMTVKAEKIGQNVTFDLASNIKTFQASSYAGGNLTAPQMDLLKITNGSLGANVSLGSGSLKKLDVHNNITGDVVAFDSIGKATSKTGGIFGSLTAQTGGINNITAKKNITGDIFAAQDVDKVLSKQGTFASTLRAENVNKIIARNIDGALVSTADDIGKVIAKKKDVRDSFFLAGYDISMNGLDDMNDNNLSGGSVDNFKYGRELSNTYVAAGVITDNIYQALVGEPPDFQLSLSSYGSISINGNLVQTEAGAPEFGFLAVDDISSNLYDQEGENFIISPNLG